MVERSRGERAGVLRTVVVSSEKDQPMIESGGKAVYEAIVRRKSRAAIWRAGRRAPGMAGRPGRHEAEISACPPRRFRNLGHSA